MFVCGYVCSTFLSWDPIWLTDCGRMTCAFFLVCRWTGVYCCIWRTKETCWFCILRSWGGVCRSDRKARLLVEVGRTGIIHTSVRTYHTVGRQKQASVSNIDRVLFFVERGWMMNAVEVFSVFLRLPRLVVHTSMYDVIMLRVYCVYFQRPIHFPWMVLLLLICILPK